MAEVTDTLLVRIRTLGAGEAEMEVSGLNKQLGKSTETAKTAHTHFSKLTGAFGGLKSMIGSAAGFAGVAGLGYTLKAAVGNAGDLQAAQAQLGSSLHANVRGPAKAATDQLTSFSDSLATRGGFTTPEELQSMAQFVRVTHSVVGAEHAMSLSTDVARGAHVSLGRATRAVMMAEQGHATGLSRLGITLGKHATATQALTAIQDKYGGSTKAFANTSQGALNTLRNTVEILTAKLGTALLPILTKVVDVFAKFVNQMMNGKGAGGQFVNVLKTIVGLLEDVWRFVKANSTVFEMLAGAIGGVVLAYKAWQLATEVLTGAQAALDAVMAANPITIIILAVVALVAALVVAYMKVKWFRDAVNAAFRLIKNVVLTVVNFIIAHWQLFAAYFLTVPFVIYKVVRLITDHLGDIVSFFQHLPRTIASALSGLAKIIAKPFVDAYNWIHHTIQQIWKDAKWVVDQIVNFFVKLPGRIVHALGSLGHMVGHALKSAVHGIPVVGGTLSGLLQTGGPVTRTGTYLVGEVGPELVRLPQGSYVTSNSQLGAGGGGGDIVLYNVLDGKVLSKSIVRQGLLQQSRM